MHRNRGFYGTAAAVGGAALQSAVCAAPAPVAGSVADGSPAVRGLSLFVSG